MNLLHAIELNARYGDALDRGLPLAAIYLGGHGMMTDRITAIEKTLVFAPRFTRHIIGLPQIEGTSVRTPFIIVQTVTTGLPEILATGCYHDILTGTSDGIRLAARNAVYDNALIPNSLVYPL